MYIVQLVSSSWSWVD